MGGKQVQPRSEQGREGTRVSHRVRVSVCSYTRERERPPQHRCRRPVSPRHFPSACPDVPFYRHW